ncbi:MAG: hypothetical protein R6T83_03020 [Salinibacter sp.]
MNTTIADLQNNLSELTEQLNAQKQKYIDRFFSGEEKEDPEKEDPETEEEKKPITTDDIVKEMGGKK